MPLFIDPVFTKTSQLRLFSVIENERFGLVFAKTGSINSSTDRIESGLLTYHACLAMVAEEYLNAINPM